MSKSQDARSAASHALELQVLNGGPIEKNIAEAASEYELDPRVIRSWLDRWFQSDEAIDEHCEQKRIAAENRAAFQTQLENLMAAVEQRSQEIWHACEPDGEPNWQYCCNRFLEEQGVRSAELREAARRLFTETGKRFEEARLRHLNENGTA